MAARQIDKKSESRLRWAVLVLGCLCLIANYYCYDNPSALMVPLAEATGMSSNDFALTYSVYSFPNMVLPFFGGFLCDRYGPGRVLILFALLLTGGQAIFAFGTSISSVNLILIGRVVYGLGGENMTVALSTLLADWFRGKEMAFAMGLFVSLARLGGVLNNFASPPIAKATNVAFAVWFGDFLCAGGVACAVGIYCCERVVQRAIVKGRTLGNRSDGTVSDSSLLNKSIETGSSGGHGSTQPGAAAPAGHASINAADHLGAALIDDGGIYTSAAHRNPLCELHHFKPSFWLLTVACLAIYGVVLPFNNVASEVLMERDYFKANPHGCALANPAQCQSASNPPLGSTCPSEADPSFAPPLPANFTYGNETFAPLLPSDVDCTEKRWSAPGACTQIFCHRQNAADSEATKVMSIPYGISAVASPFLGFAIDRLGGRALIAALCPLVLITAHVLLAYALEVPPEIPLVGQGFAYSVFAAALWPSIPYTVPLQHEGLAYGVVTALQNAGLGGFPLLLSGVYGAAGQHYIPYTEMLFIGVAGVGFCAGVGLQLYDTAHGRVLNKVHLDVKHTMSEGETAPTDTPQHEQSRPGFSALVD